MGVGFLPGCLKTDERLKFNMPADFRICLINPGKILQPQPPLGLAYIAAYLRKYGRCRPNIKIADENTGENVKKTLKNFKPDIVGITATTPHIYRAGEIASFVKGLDSRIPVVIGGPHVSALPDVTLKNFDFDAGVIGEGEEIFCKLTDSFLENHKSFNEEALNGIEGIVFKTDRRIRLTPQGPHITEIDSIPIPARDLLDMDFYLRPEMAIRGHLLRATTIFTSRGCPYNCRFCASPFLTKRKVRFHSPEYVISEVKSLCKTYPGLEGLFFLDDTFTVNQERIRRICNGFIEEGLASRISWSCQGRVNLIKRDDIPLYQLMKNAGCIQMEFGFESGSDRVLGFIKGDAVNAGQNQSAVDIIKDTGISIFGNFMVGIPTETREEMLMTRNFIEKNLRKIDFFQMYFMTPYPGTQFWDEYNLTEKADDNDFWRLFHSGYSGYEENLTSRVKDVDLDSAKVVERRINYLAAKQVSFKYKLTWVISRLFYAPAFTLKKLITFMLDSVRRD